MKTPIEIGHAPKTIELTDGSKLHFWYANNKGRGTNNCTIIRTNDPRSALSANQTGVIAMVTTSAWNGNVNFSQQVQACLGL